MAKIKDALLNGERIDGSKLQNFEEKSKVFKIKPYNRNDDLREELGVSLAKGQADDFKRECDFNPLG